MKFLFLLILAGCFVNSAHAQYLPNPDFEFWVETEHDTLPKDWANSQFGVGRTSGGAHGEYAVTIWNWYFYSKGRIALGEKDILENDLIRSGIPFPLEGKGTFVLNGHYKYVLGSNGGQGTTDDSAVVFILLKKYNHQTQHPDTAAFAIKKLGPADTYTLFSVPIYVNRDSVDSLALLFYSSERGFCHEQSDGNCLYLSIDNLHYSFFNGLNVESEIASRHRAPFPNPFTNVISFGRAAGEHHLIITNLAGIEVAAMRYSANEEMLLDGSRYPLGTYFYRIISTEGIISGHIIKQ